MRAGVLSDWMPRWSKELTFGDEDGCSTFADVDELRHLLDLLKKRDINVIVEKYDVTQEYKFIDVMVRNIK